MSHTPGPWKHVAIAGGWDGVADDGGAIICRLGLNEPSNATLIAAAPDLLASLKDMLSQFNYFVRHGYLVRRSDAIACATLDQAEAAIAKAEGREK